MAPVLDALAGVLPLPGAVEAIGYVADSGSDAGVIVQDILFLAGYTVVTLARRCGEAAAERHGLGAGAAHARRQCPRSSTCATTRCVPERAPPEPRATRRRSVGSSCIRTPPAGTGSGCATVTPRSRGAERSALGPRRRMRSRRCARVCRAGVSACSPTECPSRDGRSTGGLRWPDRRSTPHVAASPPGKPRGRYRLVGSDAGVGVLGCGGG